MWQCVEAGARVTIMPPQDRWQAGGGGMRGNRGGGCIGSIIQGAGGAKDGMQVRKHGEDAEVQM